MKQKLLPLLALAATLTAPATIAEELLVGWDVFDDPLTTSAANVQNVGFTGTLVGTDLTRGGFGSTNNTYGDLDATTFLGVSDATSSANNHRVIMSNAGDRATFSITNGTAASTYSLNRFAFDVRTSDKFEGSTNNTATSYDLYHAAASDLNIGDDTLIQRFTIEGQANQQLSVDISSLGSIAHGETAVFYIDVVGANNWSNSLDNIGITGTQTFPTPTEDFEDNENAGAVSDGQLVYALFSDWGGTGITADQKLSVSTAAPANAFMPSSGHALFYEDNDTVATGALRLQKQSNDNNTGLIAAADALTTFTFDFRYVAGNAIQNMHLLVGDADSLNTLFLELYKGTGDTGQIFNSNDGVAVDGGASTLNKDTWYRYELIINSQTDSYDLTVTEAGSATATYAVSDLPIKNSSGVVQDLGAITRVEFTTFDGVGKSGYQAYFDNFNLIQEEILPPPPNFLFIVVDDLNDSVEGFGGHPQAITPNIDRLASRGIRFLNAASNAPLCAPSRPSFLTGLYPHTTKYIGNPIQTALNAEGTAAVYKEAWSHQVFIDSKTWVQYFREQGYDVYGAGKIDHNYSERISDWTVNGVVEYGPEASWGPFPWDGTADDTPEGANFFKDEDSMNFRRAAPHDTMPKFKHLSYFVPLSDVPATPAWPLAQAEPDGYSGYLEEGFAGHTGWYLYNAPYHYVDANNRDPMPDELLAEYAEDFFEARAASGDSKPFFMNIGINRPHAPLVAPDEYFDMYPLETLITFPLQTAPADDLADCAPFLYKDFNTDNITWVSGFGKYKNIIGGTIAEGGDGSNDPNLLKEWTQAYLACVTFADAQIGRILDALEDPDGDGDTSDSMADNTIVVLTSDHGWNMGEKFYVFKNSPWEESVKVPFIVAGPGVAIGEECTKPISLIDMYPTFIELAGLAEAAQPPQTLDGHSLVPLLIDPVNGTWAGPDVSLSAVATSNHTSAGFAEPTILSTVYNPEGHIFSVRSEQYRYIICPDGSSELYDMIADPYAYVNQTDNPALAAVKQSLHDQAEALVGRPLGVFFQSESYDLSYPRPQWYQDNDLSGRSDLTEEQSDNGLPLLASYALNLDLDSPLASGDLPILASASLPSTGLDFRFYADALGVSYKLLQTDDLSNDLVDWTPVDISGLTTDVDGYKTYNIPSAGPGNSFYRLSFSQE